MTFYHSHAFVDGGYLRSVSKNGGIPYPDPFQLCTTVINRGDVESWARPAHEPRKHIILTRIVFYDAPPDSSQDSGPQSADMRAYWSAIELLPDTSLGFGFLRGRRGREPRQKAVDTLMAVDMVVGAFTGLYSLALLVTGDADLVPVVDEVRRRGAAVVVVAEASSLSSELRAAADRVVFIGPEQPCVAVRPLIFKSEGPGAA